MAETPDRRGISLEQLNTFQYQAVTSISKSLLVKAIVGSGKTTVLTAKIWYLYEKCGVSLDDMMVLTFTNKAANEIRERLQLELPLLGTFHGIALKLLKEYYAVEQFGFTKDFQVILPEEEYELACTVMQENNLQIKYKNRLRKRLDDHSKKDGIEDDLELLKKLLQEKKISLNKMSFSDLIKYANLLSPQQLYHPKYLIVDEVQDCDWQQVEFIKNQTDAFSYLFAVGDPNQIIYGWRGSVSKVFDALKDYYRAEEITLPVNYRSGKRILDVASYFCENANTIVAADAIDSQVYIREHYNPFQEATYLADSITDLISKGIKANEIGIFFRMQSQAELLMRIFIREGIPYTYTRQENLQNRAVLKWLLAVLRSSLSPEDAMNERVVLMDAFYGLGLTAKKADKMRVEEALPEDHILRKTRGFLAYFEKNQMSIDAIWQYFQFEKKLHPSTNTYKSDTQYVKFFLEKWLEESSGIARLNREENNVHVLAAGNGVYTVESLISGLNNMALQGFSINEGEQKTEGVQLMTLHASKGLEFRYVYIIGVNPGLIPLQGNIYEENDEEKRVFFVGMTRAKECLELSYYTNADTARVGNGPSYFLSIIPRNLVMFCNEKIEGGQNLIALKNMIKDERKKEFAVEKKENSEQHEPSAVGWPKSEIKKQDIRYIRHPKYGRGKVVQEDETMVTAEFDGYGEKTFLIGFEQFEYES